MASLHIHVHDDDVADVFARPTEGLGAVKLVIGDDVEVYLWPEEVHGLIDKLLDASLMRVCDEPAGTHEVARAVSSAVEGLFSQIAVQFEIEERERVAEAGQADAA